MPTPSDKPKRSVFIIDYHPLVREWLSIFLNQQSDLSVCGDASSRAEALERVPAAKPEIVVVDISLEGNSGFELIKELTAAIPGLSVIVFSMHDQSVYGERAIRAGARGYVMKREATKQLLHAIRSVLEGKLFINEEISAALVHEKFEPQGRPAAATVTSLSDRELKVFELIGYGYNTRQIAAEMNVTMKTVQAFCVRIKRKLGLNSVTQLRHDATRWHERRCHDTPKP